VSFEGSGPVAQVTRDLVATLAGSSADPAGTADRLYAVIEARPDIADDVENLTRAGLICGVSRSLGASLAQHPWLLDGEPDPGATVSLLLRSRLVPIVAEELGGVLDLEQATARWSAAVDDLVSQTLREALRALADRYPILESLPFAVIALGKWGANELNYYSDIDLVFVHETDDDNRAEARAAAIALAGKVLHNLSAPTFEGSAFVADADLRPEGSMGPLSRSLESYRAYYDRWAEAWELQALLKARAAAGDRDLGRRFEAMARHYVWERGLDPEALRSIRILKTRAEEEANPRDVKRAPGGIRDIEFAVQVLQLVHGRFDSDLRVRSTLEAIRALGEHGYIEPAEAESLAASYRFLRAVEHRLQLWDLTQTHTLPTGREERERLGRSLGWMVDPVGGLDARLLEVRSDVRDLHERLYFRPILEALAGISTATLSEEEARLRLAALGFRDVAAAVTAFEEMTSGLSRRSRAMQQALPLTLDWLSRSPDPDLGLAQLRLLLANTSDHGALATLLQTNPIAGERLCMLLGTGRLLGALLDRIPEFIPRLAQDQPDWDIRDAAGATDRLIGLLDARPDADAKIGTIRRFLRRRTLRIAARDILDGAPAEETTASLSDGADATMLGTLHALEAGDGFGIIALGKWGGRELSYGSDIDLIYVYGNEGDRDDALHLAADIARVVAEPGRHGPGLILDLDLRPEGKRGPLVRSLDGFRRYYEQWVEPWEVLALVKARPVAGDPSVLADFAELIDRVVWGTPPDHGFVRAIRTVKARVESERLPPGSDPEHHLKLGPGGLSDIEFLTQLLQLRRGSEDPALRVRPTLDALARLADAGILNREEHRALDEAYRFLTRLRLRLHLQGGQGSDTLPTTSDGLSRLAASLGFDRRTDLAEQHRRHRRRARRIFEARFFE
jgi:[glutamine synthetase] adenylyltransferase / [glutamine synthetase]-adenylyl-L-tyrosine phosphorylase